MSPYDWQESIGQRAQYVENRLAKGIPAVAISLPEGILAASFRRQGRKVFEVYDSLLMTGLGQQADVEALRVAAIEFCHREGFQRSGDDVTLQRLETGLSRTLKQAFGDLRSAPFLCRCLFAEMGRQPQLDRFVVLDYDGDYRESSQIGILHATEDQESALRDGAKAIEGSPREAAEKIGKLIREVLPELPEDAILEAGFLDRGQTGERRFQLFSEPK